MFEREVFILLGLTFLLPFIFILFGGIAVNLLAIRLGKELIIETGHDIFRGLIELPSYIYIVFTLIDTALISCET